jgi:hypothetical protein
MQNIKRGSDGKRPEPPSLVTFAHWHGDSSGSMASMGSAGEDGGRDFMKEWRDHGQKNPDSSVRLSFHSFSTDGRTVFRGDARDVDESTVDECAKSMRPTASTKLFDTAVPEVRKMITAMRAAYDAQSVAVRRLHTLESLIRGIFVCFTDGNDNQSCLCGPPDLKQAFADLKAVGGTVIFGAANMNAAKVGADYGIAADQCLQMGSDLRTGSAALESITKCSLRCATSGGGLAPPPAPCFSGVERTASCSATEACRYGAPSHGRGSTAPPAPVCVPQLRRSPNIGDPWYNAPPYRLNHRVNAIAPPTPLLGLASLCGNSDSDEDLDDGSLAPPNGLRMCRC